MTVSDYIPTPRWRGGHRMTVYAWARRRAFPHLPQPEARYFDVAPDARVLAECYWQRERQQHPGILALHGLEGSSRAHYMRGLADKALALGFNAILLNQRNCGGTEHLSAGLYHSGLTHDAGFVIRELIAQDGLPSIGVIGYSLGGNLALKLAGDYGTEAPPQLTAVCAVSPTMDLGLCVRALERRSNFIYQWNFVRNLKRRMRRKAALVPDRYDLAPLARASDNDPFVPWEQFQAPEIAANPQITVAITRDGGHCAFVAEAADGDDGYWAERRALAFIAAARPADASQTPRPSLPLRA